MEIRGVRLDEHGTIRNACRHRVRECGCPVLRAGRRDESWAWRAAVLIHLGATLEIDRHLRIKGSCDKWAQLEPP